MRALTFVSLLMISAALTATPAAGRLGVNLDANGAFVNLINHTNRYNDVAAFDAQGWPMDDFSLVVMDGRPAQEWNSEIDDPEEYRIDYSGIYKCSFKGQAILAVQGTGFTLADQAYDAPTNTTTFAMQVSAPGPNHSLLIIGFSNTKRTAASAADTGITEIKVMRPGYALDTDRIFTDEYIALCKSADFSCYRYYTLQNIWAGDPLYPAQMEWSNRKLPADATQASMENMTGKSDGWCWEYIISLANILNKDIWICIHTSASDDYITQLAAKLKDELNKEINVYVENSNEVWSATWNENGPWNDAQAQANGITFNQNYAKRTVEISNLFKTVWGADAINQRIRVVCSGQAGWIGRNQEHLTYISSQYGPPKNYIYALSVAHYFTTSAPDGTPAEINAGMLTDIDEQLGSDASDRPQHIALAASYELPGGCTSYEGGPHVPSGGGTANLDNQIIAHRTSDMLTIMRYNLEDGWWNIGGGLALHFTLSGSYNRYGCWGLTDDYTIPHRNHKMQAMVDMAGTWREPAGSGAGCNGCSDILLPVTGLAVLAGTGWYVLKHQSTD